MNLGIPPAKQMDYYENLIYTLDREGVINFYITPNSIYKIGSPEASRLETSEEFATINNFENKKRNLLILIDKVQNLSPQAAALIEKTRFGFCARVWYNFDCGDLNEKAMIAWRDRVVNQQKKREECLKHIPTATQNTAMSVSPPMEAHLFEIQMNYLLNNDIYDCYFTNDGFIYPINSQMGNELELSPHFPLINNYDNKSQNLKKMIIGTVNLSDQEAILDKKSRIVLCKQVFDKFKANERLERDLIESRNAVFKEKLKMMLNKKPQIKQYGKAGLIRLITPTEEDESQVANWISQLRINKKLAKAAKKGTLGEAILEGLDDIQKKIDEKLQNERKEMIID